MGKRERQQIVLNLKSVFEKCILLVFVDFTGMTVEEMIDLRRIIKNVGGNFKVSKNTLIYYSIKDFIHSSIKHILFGPTGVAYTYNDPVLLSKKIIECLNNMPKLKVKGAILEGRIIDFEELKELSKLPSYSQMRAIFLSLLKSVHRKFLVLLSQTQRNFLYLLNARKDKLEKEQQNN